MGKPVKKSAAPRRKRTGNSDSAVEAVFGAYPNPVKAKLLALRRLIFDTADATKGVGSPAGSPEMGAAELSHDREQERQHHPDRPGEGGSRPVRGLFPLPDRSGRDFSRALSGTALWRQPQHSARRRREAARGSAAPLRRAGVDVSCEEAEGGRGHCVCRSWRAQRSNPSRRYRASIASLRSQ